MRHEPTDAENKMWQHISKKQLGIRFRRQHPVKLPTKMCKNT